MTLARDFKGIWIPKEIWLHPELSLQAKALWAEIHSLYSNSHGGCFASNEYLCQFLGVKERALQYILKELRDNSLLVDVSFDGRRRIFKALDPSIGAGQPRIDSAEQGCKTLHPSDAKKCHPESEVPNALPIYTEKKELEKRKGVPSKPKIEKIPYREFVHLTEEEHTNILTKYGEDKVKRMLDKLNVYKESKGVKYESDYALFKEGSWLLKAIEETLPSKAPQSTVEDNRKWAAKFDRGESNGWKISCCPSYLEFNHATFSERFVYEKENFKELVRDELYRKGFIKEEKT